MSTKLLAFIILVLASVTVNAQSQATNHNKFIGQAAFDEIVVSSDLSVIRRKSKENRQGKLLLTNVPSGTTSPPGKSALASRLVLSDGSSVTSESRRKRSANWAYRRLSKRGIVEYLLRPRRP